MFGIGKEPARKVVAPAKKVWLPIAFSAVGEPGQIVRVEKKSVILFRGMELYAFDTSSRQGHGTVIKGAYVGNQAQFVDTPTWVFGEWTPPEDRKGLDATVRTRMADAAAKLTWSSCDILLSHYFDIEFMESCKWEAVLWGWAVR